MTPRSNHNEARVFTKNAARAVRDVGMAWLMRKLFLPLAIVLVLVTGMVFEVNGLLAALPAAAILIAYTSWVFGFYRRNFLAGVLFRGNKPTDGND